MITVRKANKVLRIDENNKENYLARGYDVVNEKGEIVEHNTRTVTPAEYAAALAEIGRLKAEIAKLKAKKKETAGEA